jgi:hypothetical protein
VALLAELLLAVVIKKGHPRKEVNER